MAGSRDGVRSIPVYLALTPDNVGASGVEVTQAARAVLGDAFMIGVRIDGPIGAAQARSTNRELPRGFASQTIAALYAAAPPTPTLTPPPIVSLDELWEWAGIVGQKGELNPREPIWRQSMAVVIPDSLRRFIRAAVLCHLVVASSRGKWNHPMLSVYTTDTVATWAEGYADCPLLVPPGKTPVELAAAFHQLSRVASTAFRVPGIFTGDAVVVENFTRISGLLSSYYAFLGARMDQANAARDPAELRQATGAAMCSWVTALTAGGFTHEADWTGPMPDLAAAQGPVPVMWRGEAELTEICRHSHPWCGPPKGPPPKRDRGGEAAHGHKAQGESNAADGPSPSPAPTSSSSSSAASSSSASSPSHGSKRPKQKGKPPRA